jgi:hypothetical protein
MPQDIDAFTLRIAIAITKRNEGLAETGGIGVRQPATGGLGALRDLYHSVAGPSEGEPASMAVGLDCSHTDEQTFERDAGNDARDVLAVFSDHVLIVSNPARGASLGGLVKLVIGGIGKKTSQRNIPHSRIDRGSIRAAEVCDGRPAWHAEHERFVRIQTDDGEIFFWAELLVDSDDDVRSSIEQLTDAAGT